MGGDTGEGGGYGHFSLLRVIGESTCERRKEIGQWPNVRDSATPDPRRTGGRSGEADGREITPPLYPPMSSPHPPPF